jgi:hypothetical protein
VPRKVPTAGTSTFAWTLTRWLPLSAYSACEIDNSFNNSYYFSAEHLQYSDITALFFLNHCYLNLASSQVYWVNTAVEYWRFYASPFCTLSQHRGLPLNFPVLRTNGFALNNKIHSRLAKSNENNKIFCYCPYDLHYPKGTNRKHTNALHRFNFIY